MGRTGEGGPRCGRRAFLGGLGAWVLSGCGEGPPGGPTGTGEASLSGRVVSLFDPNRPMATGRVHLGAERIGTVFDGDLRVQSLPVGRSVLTLAGTGHVDRRIAVDVVASGPNRLPDVTVTDREVAGVLFDVAAANEMLRQTNFPSVSGSVTARWVEAPRVFVHRPSLVGGGSALGGTRTRLELVREALADAMPVLSDGLFDGRWTEGDDLDEMPPEGTPGTIVVRGFAEQDEFGFTGLTFGDANTAFEMQWCVVQLSRQFLDSTPTHELVHTLHTSHTQKVPSIMALGANHAPLPTLWDLAFCVYLYRRPPGTAEPDDTSGVEVFTTRPM